MKWHHRSSQLVKIQVSDIHSTSENSVERICAPSGLITLSFEFGFKLVRHTKNTFVNDSAINSYFLTIF